MLLLVFSYDYFWCLRLNQGFADSALNTCSITELSLQPWKLSFYSKNQNHIINAKNAFGFFYVLSLLLAAIPFGIFAFLPYSQVRVE